MNLAYMQRLDRFVGPKLCSLLTFCKALVPFLFVRRRASEKIRNVLVIKFWGMGSIILASGGIRALRETLPDARVIFLTLESNGELLRLLNGLCDEVVLVKTDQNLLAFAFHVMRILLQLRRRQMDVVVDLEFFTCFSAIISALVGAHTIAGFYDTSVWRGKLHNVCVPFNRYWHVKRNFENLCAKAIGARFDDNLALVTPIAAKNEEDEAIWLLKQNKIGVEDVCICVNPNAGNLALERRWQAENYIALIKKLTSAYPFLRILLIGLKSEWEYVQRIAEACASANVINFAGRLSLAQLVALLKRSALLITNDSGPLHLAMACGTPTVSFFGPETPILYPRFCS